jgi:hypothetical protein
MKLSIAQALTYKKRVVEALTGTSDDLKKYNSVITFDGVANRDGVDIKSLISRRTQLKNYLVGLKLALWKASEEIRESILTLAELKDDVVFWSALTTTDGKSKDRYESEVSIHDAVYKKSDVNETVRDLKRNIDQKQQLIEAFNHTHFVEIEDIGI